MPNPDAFTVADWIAAVGLSVEPWQSIVLLDTFGIPAPSSDLRENT